MRRLLTGLNETTYTCCACGYVSRHVDRMTTLNLALPETVTRPLKEVGEADEACTAGSLLAFGPKSRLASSKKSEIKSHSQEVKTDSHLTETAGSRQQPCSGQERPHDNQQQTREHDPDSEHQRNPRPDTDPSISDLLQHCLAPERLCEDNQYHCVRCDGLRDANRRYRLLTSPPHLVVSLVRSLLDQQNGTLRKVLAPVALTERLAVPLAGQPAVQYLLYAVVVHSGLSLDAGHYFSFCRASGSGGGSNSADGGW